MISFPRKLLSIGLLGILIIRHASAVEFRVATYNVENYLDEPSGTRPAKSAEARAMVRESILSMKPDILALEEMGGTNALMELRNSLKAQGLDLPYWEHVTGYDTNIHVAILSRFPFSALRPQTNDYFLLAGSRFRVSRGFAELDVKVSEAFSFTLLAAHLKSKRPIPEVDESDLRLEEAKVLREKIDALLAANPQLPLVVLGDLNDLPDSKPIRTIIGRGRKGLVDLRPAERNGDEEAKTDRRLAHRNIAWTHFYSKDDTYSRIDYILVSRSMESMVDPAGTYIPTLPKWGMASDHRPVAASFNVK